MDFLLVQFHLTMRVSFVFPINFIMSFSEYNSISNILNEIVNKALENPEVITSSNPYDYVKNNPYYDALVKEGIDVIPRLEKLLDDSESNGYREYIIAILIEDILNMNLKAEAYNWDSSAKFRIVYDNHLKTIKSKIEEILGENLRVQDKSVEIQKLGYIAIPELMELSKKGNTEAIIIYNDIVEKYNKKSSVKLSKFENRLKFLLEVSTNTKLNNMSKYIEEHQ